MTGGYKRVPGYEVLDCGPISPEELARKSTVELSGHDVQLLKRAINKYLWYLDEATLKDGKPRADEFTELDRIHDMLAATNLTFHNHNGGSNS